MARSGATNVQRQRALLRARKLTLQVRQQETREELRAINDTLKQMRPAKPAAAGATSVASIIGRRR